MGTEQVSGVVVQVATVLPIHPADQGVHAVAVRVLSERPWRPQPQQVSTLAVQVVHSVTGPIVTPGRWRIGQGWKTWTPEASPRRLNLDDFSGSASTPRQGTIGLTRATPQEGGIS